MSTPRPSVAALLAEPGPAVPAGAGVAELRALWDGVVVGRLSLVRDRGPLHAVRDLLTDGGVPVRLYLPTPDSEHGPPTSTCTAVAGGWAAPTRSTRCAASSPTASARGAQRRLPARPRAPLPGPAR